MSPHIIFVPSLHPSHTLYTEVAAEKPQNAPQIITDIPYTILKGHKKSSTCPITSVYCLHFILNFLLVFYLYLK